MIMHFVNHPSVQLRGLLTTYSVLNIRRSSSRAVRQYYESVVVLSLHERGTNAVVFVIGNICFVHLCAL